MGIMNPIVIVLPCGTELVPHGLECEYALNGGRGHDAAVRYFETIVDMAMSGF